jgi:hypothetical protein
MLPLYFTRSLQPIHRSVKFKLSIARIHNARGQLRPSSRFIVQNDGLCDSLHGLAHLLAMPLQRLSRCPRVERRFLNRPRKIVFGTARQRDYRNEGNPQAVLGGWRTSCDGFDLPGGRSFAGFEGAEGLVFLPLIFNSIESVDSDQPLIEFTNPQVPSFPGSEHVATDE